MSSFAHIRTNILAPPCQYIPEIPGSDPEKKFICPTGIKTSVIECRLIRYNTQRT